MRSTTTVSWIITLTLIVFASYMAVSSGHNIPTPLFLSEFEAWKAGHFLAFFSIAITLSFSLWRTLGATALERKIFWSAIAIFAIATEMAQLLTLAHKPSSFDVAIDVLGAACGRAAYLWFRHQLAGRHTSG